MLPDVAESPADCAVVVVAFLRVSRIVHGLLELCVLARRVECVDHLLAAPVYLGVGHGLREPSADRSQFVVRHF